MDTEIMEAKIAFNTFFKRDLYGKYRSKKNIILSRGSWNDDFLKSPLLFKFALDYALNKNWFGYSNSLGHERTLKALLRFVNHDRNCKYKISNLCSTLGNVATIGHVFRQLSSDKEIHLLTLCPYYPPIIKSVSFYCKSVQFIDSLQEEDCLIENIKKVINSGEVNTLLLNNMIGVEGRIYSPVFWNRIMKITKSEGVTLVIDEGLWFNPLSLGDHINSEHVIRLISLSKKYGVPGFKVGYLIASEKFIENYYETASTNYGGPQSVFFLLLELLFTFEYINNSEKSPRLVLGEFSRHYKLEMSQLLGLYDDFVESNKINKQHILNNQYVLNEWLQRNREYYKDVYNFDGMNVLIRLNISDAYSFFLYLLKKYKTSVLPSLCLGDKTDSMIRVTVLEDTVTLSKGLENISKALRKL